MKHDSIKWLHSMLVALYGCIFLIIIVATILDDDHIEITRTATHIYIDGMISIDGGPNHKISNALLKQGIHHSLTMTGNFSSPIATDQYLILWPRNLRVKLFVNGIQRISTGQREEFPWFIEYAGNSFQAFPIGPVSPKDQIRIEVEKAYDSCRINVITSFFENMYVGYESSLYQSIIKYGLLQSCISIFLVLCGFLLFSVAVLGNFSPALKPHRIYCLSAFCIIGGIAYLYDSSYEYIDLLFPHPVLNTIIDLCSAPALLLTYLLFFNTLAISHKTKHMLRWLILLFLIIESIPLILQFTGILDLHVMQDTYIVIGNIILLLGYGCIVLEALRYHQQRLKNTILAVIPIVLVLFFKTLDILFERGPGRSYIQLSILFSFIPLFYNTLEYMKRSTIIMAKEKEMLQELQNAQISIMLSQIKPHFLYNSLNTLGYLCKKDPDIAAEGIEHFSRYLRSNTEFLGETLLVPFTQELKHLEDYLYLEKLRFGERVQVDYELEVTDFLIPTLTIQPLVENAIRHGITKQQAGGTIKIRTRKENDEIILVISDDGIGFDSCAIGNDSTTHIGLENVKKRLELQCNAVFEIVSQPGMGTMVTIRMKGDPLL